MLKNCWEFKGCGREPGGERAEELGVCPASTNAACDGVNHGQNAGRVCWAVAGTFCGGKVQGTSAAKKITCLACEYYDLVNRQEGLHFLIRPSEKEEKKDLEPAAES